MFLDLRSHQQHPLLRCRRAWLWETSLPPHQGTGHCLRKVRDRGGTSRVRGDKRAIADRNRRAVLIFGFCATQHCMSNGWSDIICYLPAPSCWPEQGATMVVALLYMDHTSCQRVRERVLPHKVPSICKALGSGSARVLLARTGRSKLSVPGSGMVKPTVSPFARHGIIRAMCPLNLKLKSPFHVCYVLIEVL